MEVHNRSSVRGIKRDADTVKANNSIQILPPHFAGVAFIKATDFLKGAERSSHAAVALSRGQGDGLVAHRHVLDASIVGRRVVRRCIHDERAVAAAAFANFPDSTQPVFRDEAIVVEENDVLTGGIAKAGIPSAVRIGQISDAADVLTRMLYAADAADTACRITPAQSAAILAAYNSKINLFP